MLFLEKEVYFQGAEMKLSSIISKDDIGMLNALSSDSISRLLENEKLPIGRPIEDTVQYYIDRTLQCNKKVISEAPIQREIKHEYFEGVTRYHFVSEEGIGKRNLPRVDTQHIDRS
jgi:hypothetical protein